MKLRSLGPRFRPFAHHAVTPEPKYRDPLYVSPDYLRWRNLVLTRAGARCEAMTGKVRCAKAMPTHRMFADHIHEVKDGGDPFDPLNGQCLCGAHHTLKTTAARARRMAT